jgi:hypothetical protein
MDIEIIKSSVWCCFSEPFAEPEYDWKRFEGDRPYHTERVESEDGSIVWFGIKVNWKKEKDGQWTILTNNLAAKPVRWTEDMTPIYGEDRMIWEECEMPVYEKLYLEKIGSETDIR